MSSPNISSTQTRSRCVSFSSIPSWFSWTSLMVHSGAKLKSNGNKSSCFRSSWTGNASERFSSMWTLLYVLFKHILISLTTFTGIPISLWLSHRPSWSLCITDVLSHHIHPFFFQYGWMLNIRSVVDIWGPFAKFVDSPYYSELDLYGGAVTVSF